MGTIELERLAEAVVTAFKEPFPWNRPLFMTISKTNQECLDKNKSKNNGWNGWYDLEISKHYTWGNTVTAYKHLTKLMEDFDCENTRDKRRSCNGIVTWERAYHLNFQNVRLTIGNKMRYTRYSNESGNQVFFSTNSKELFDLVVAMINKDLQYNY